MLNAITTRASRTTLNSLFQPRKKRRRGVHRVRESLSTKRIAAQFGEEDHTITYQSKKSASCVQHGLGDNDRAANNNWVSIRFVLTPATSGCTDIDYHSQAKAVLTVLGIHNDMNPVSCKHQRVTFGNMAAEVEGTQVVSDLPDIATPVDQHARTLDRGETTMLCHEKVSDLLPIPGRLIGSPSLTGRMLCQFRCSALNAIFTQQMKIWFSVWTPSRIISLNRYAILKN